MAERPSLFTLFFPFIQYPTNLTKIGDWRNCQSNKPAARYYCNDADRRRKLVRRYTSLKTVFKRRNIQTEDRYRGIY